jgi:cytidylate kinase
MNKNRSNNTITIDGPAGSGKSTIAKILARDLDLKYIDTGAMYRAMTLIALKNDIDLEDEESILARAKNIKLEIDSKVSDESSYTKLRLDDVDVTDEIRSREVGAAVSIVSKLSGIRKYLVSIQRKLAGEGNAVLEGRDTGSVVCPIKNRDLIDSSRKDSPLVIPEDGIEIDTSDMTIMEVVKKIKKLYYGRTKT